MVSYNTELMPLALGDTVLIFDLQNLVTTCQVQRVRELKNLGEEKQLIQLLNDFQNVYLPNFLISGQNIADPRLLPVIANIAEIAAETGDLNLAIMSLIALKFIYIDLVDHFVERDSIALRAAQSEFERILVSASKVASSYRPMDMTQQQTFNIFIDQLDLVADSVKVILLSEQTRQRFMGGIGTDNLDDPSILATYDEEFADLLSHLSKAKKNLANSDGVLSYISGKAQLGDHNIDVTPQPFIAKEIFSYLKMKGV